MEEGAPNICWDYAKGKCARKHCRYSHDDWLIEAAARMDKSGVCFDFVRGTCFRGNSCRFSHDLGLLSSKKSVGICFDFLKGRCSRGVACKFSHDPDSTSAVLKSNGVCYDFTKGRCQRGLSCRFSHDLQFAKRISKAYSNFSSESSHVENGIDYTTADLSTFHLNSIAAAVAATARAQSQIQEYYEWQQEQKGIPIQFQQPKAGSNSTLSTVSSNGCPTIPSSPSSLGTSPSSQQSTSYGAQLYHASIVQSGLAEGTLGNVWPMVDSGNTPSNRSSTTGKHEGVSRPGASRSRSVLNPKTEEFIRSQISLEHERKAAAFRDIANNHYKDSYPEIGLSQGQGNPICQKTQVQATGDIEGLIRYFHRLQSSFLPNQPSVDPAGIAEAYIGESSGYVTEREDNNSYRNQEKLPLEDLENRSMNSCTRSSDQDLTTSLMAEPDIPPVSDTCYNLYPPDMHRRRLDNAGLEASRSTEISSHGHSRLYSLWK